MGLERCPLSLVNITEELLHRKSRGSRSRKLRLTAVGIRFADHATPIYQQKLALTSPTSGGRSVGIFCLRLQPRSLVISLCYICTHTHTQSAASVIRTNYSTSMFASSNRSDYWISIQIWFLSKNCLFESFIGRKDMASKEPACHLLSRRSLAWHIDRPWRWRRHVLPKRRLSFCGLHDVSQKLIKQTFMSCCSFLTISFSRAWSRDWWCERSWWIGTSFSCARFKEALKLEMASSCLPVFFYTSELHNFLHFPTPCYLRFFAKYSQYFPLPVNIHLRTVIFNFSCIPFFNLCVSHICTQSHCVHRPMYSH
jgi:hypothetical protein